MGYKSAFDVRAKEIMTRAPFTMYKWNRLTSAIGCMKDMEIHELPVVDRKNKLVGLLTLDGVLRRGKREANARVNSAMTKPPLLHEDSSLPEIAKTLIENDYRAVPIVDDNRIIVGIVTRTDVVKAMKGIKERFVEKRLEEVMAKELSVVHEEDTIPEVRAIMRRMKVPTLPVVNSDGILIGVIGEKDISNFFEIDWENEDVGEYVGEQIPVDSNVWSFMSEPAIYLRPNDTVGDAIDKMLENDISSVVIVENMIPIGMIRKWDIVNMLTLLEKKDMIYVQISGLRGKEQIVYDVIYDIIQKHVRKIGERFKVYGITMVVREYGLGKGKKYSIHARLHTPFGIFSSQTYDWDIFIAVDDLMTNFVSRISKIKEGRQPKHRLMGTESVKEWRAIADAAYTLPDYYLEGTEEVV